MSWIVQELRSREEQGLNLGSETCYSYTSVIPVLYLLLLVLPFDPEEGGIIFRRSVSKYSTRLHYVSSQKILLYAVPAVSVTETKFERLSAAVALYTRVREGSVRNSIRTPAVST